MSDAGSPDARLRTFISRILRLKEDQDDIQTDIQEVYAEAKAEGYDKTAMGQVVSIIRKRLKDPSKFEEHSSVVQMYLDAFDGGAPRTRVRAREEHDLETGEVLVAPAEPRRLEPRIPEPAPEWPEMPAALDRRNQQQEAAE